MVIDLVRDLRVLILSIIYAIVGVLLLLAAYRVWDMATPSDLSREIFENKNAAVAIMTGFFVLAIALIIAAAIHG